MREADDQREQAHNTCSVVSQVAGQNWFELGSPCSLLQPVDHNGYAGFPSSVMSHRSGLPTMTLVSVQRAFHDARGGMVCLWHLGDTPKPLKAAALGCVLASSAVMLAFMSEV